MAYRFTQEEMGVLVNFITDLYLMGREEDAKKVGLLMNEVDRYRNEKANKPCEPDDSAD